MTYDADERSTAGNRPIDLYTIAAPSGTYHLTSHVVDVVYGGLTYVATVMTRSAQQVAQDLVGREIVVYLPISHPIVQRFTATGIPEHEVIVTLQRLQSTSGVAIQQWSGFGNGLSIEGRLALLRVPSLTDDAMRIKLPVVRAQKLCNHVLYDQLCQVNRTSASNIVSLMSSSGTTVVIASWTGSDTLNVFGELLHNASSQRRQILAQTGTTITINVPLVDVAAGEALTLFPGCDHTIVTCRDKFSNVVNYGGMPDLNATIHPWAPKGLGIVQQT